MAPRKTLSEDSFSSKCLYTFRVWTRMNANYRKVREEGPPAVDGFSNIPPSTIFQDVVGHLGTSDMSGQQKNMPSVPLKWRLSLLYNLAKMNTLLAWPLYISNVCRDQKQWTICRYEVSLYGKCEWSLVFKILNSGDEWIVWWATNLLSTPGIIIFVRVSDSYGPFLAADFPHLTIQGTLC